MRGVDPDGSPRPPRSACVVLGRPRTGHVVLDSRDRSRELWRIAYARRSTSAVADGCSSYDAGAGWSKAEQVQRRRLRGSVSADARQNAGGVRGHAQVRKGAGG
jgi:hypothetical protein